MASQITSLMIVYWTVYSGADQRKHPSCASLAFVRGIHRWPVNLPQKGPVTRKMFTFDDVIMNVYILPEPNHSKVQQLQTLCLITGACWLFDKRDRLPLSEYKSILVADDFCQRLHWCTREQSSKATYILNSDLLALSRKTRKICDQ